MPKTANSITKELYDVLKTKGFKPEAIKSGKKAIVPEEASGFNFHFRDGRKQYSSAHIAIDDLRDLILFYNKSSMSDAGRSWTDFLKELKNWAMRRGLGMKLDAIDNITDYYAHRENSAKLTEGYYGTRNTSYSDKTPKTVKLIIKHNRPLDENDQRYRYVDKIFVENELGERFVLPTKKPSEGYAYARLIAEGGNPYDERGKHISEISSDISKLSGFVRATRNKQFNESVGKLVEQATQQYYKLRETMRSLRTSRGFKNYFENWKPTLTENDDISTLENAFKSVSIDHRIEQALPVLSKHNIVMTEMSETKQFESWINQFINEELDPNLQGQVDELVALLDDDSEPLSLGPDASNVIGQLDNLLQDNRLFNRLIRAAKADPNNDARPLIIGWMSENSDNDVYNKVLDRLESADESEKEIESEPAKLEKDSKSNSNSEPETIASPDTDNSEPESSEEDILASAMNSEKENDSDSELSRIKDLSGIRKK